MIILSESPAQSGVPLNTKTYHMTNNVYFVDDSEEDRRDFVSVLSNKGLSLRTFVSGDEFLAQVPHLEPGCVVLDVLMPGTDGLTVVKTLSAMRPGWPVIMLSGHADVPLAVEAMKRGAKDFVEKPFIPSDLLAAIERCFELMRRAPDTVSAKRLPKLSEIITPREMDVLRLLIAGQQNKGIAFHLGISERTVEVHRARLMRRLGVRSFAELIRKAVQHDLDAEDGENHRRL